jgi:hypothetical protein
VLDDGYTYTDPFLLGSSSVQLDVITIPKLLAFSSSAPSAIAVNAYGDATLLDNFDAGITLDATSQAGCRASPPASSLIQVCTKPPGPKCGCA